MSAGTWGTYPLNVFSYVRGSCTLGTAKRKDIDVTQKIHTIKPKEGAINPDLTHFVFQGRAGSYTLLQKLVC